MSKFSPKPFQFQDSNGLYVFEGMLNSEAKLPKLKPELDEIVIDLQHVDGIDFGGICNWVNWIKTIPSITTVLLDKVPPWLVKEMNISKNFITKNCRIRSFFVPYLDPNKNEIYHKLFSEEIDFELKMPFPNFPENDSDYGPKKCHSVVEEASYLSFLPEFDYHRFSIYDNYYDKFIILNENKQIIYCNDSAADLLGVAKKRLIKKNPFIYDLLTFDDKTHFCMPNGVYDPHKSGLVEEVTFTTKEGKLKKDQVSIQRDPSSFHTRISYVVYLRDISMELQLSDKYLTESKEKAQVSEKLVEVSDKAYRDDMTKLKNFRAFAENIVAELRRTKRYGNKFGLVILDVDHFKKFNDTYGHQQGDEVLRFVARALEKSVRDSDFVARYGGEEFVAILPEVDIPSAQIVCERIRTNIANEKVPKLDEKGVFLSVHVSVGCVLISKEDLKSWEGPDFKMFVEAADKNLYKCKENGRNCVTLSEYNR
ncbi:MAG: sensor domain-containing diguanylate cyclase [Bacteriovoracaceae bacterium]